MKTLRTIFAMALLVALLSISNSAYAGRRVYVRVSPPRPKKVVVVKPAKPWKQAVWINGHWKWQKGHWVWVKGHWKKAKPGYHWVDGHWKHTPHGWVRIKGHWAK